MVAPALHKGLFLAALTSAVFALALREPPFAPEFSRWDEAASFYLLSMMAAAFIDTAAVTATLDELQAASGMEPRQTSVSEH